MGLFRPLIWIMNFSISSGGTEQTAIDNINTVI